jgi:hypothetical protein
MYVAIHVDGSSPGVGTFVDATGHWRTPVNLGDDGQHQITVEGANGQTTAFDIHRDSAASAPTMEEHADVLSVMDVLSTGEADLFAADHLPDNAQLSVHDMEAVAVDSAVALASSVMTQDFASLSANLVLPHEPVHAVM